MNAANDEFEEGIPMQCGECGTVFVWHIEKELDDDRCASCRARGAVGVPAEHEPRS
jgi:hypothetical protein